MIQDYQKHLHEAAKQFLLVYFSDGKERMPSDFDEEIIRGLDITFMNGPRWNNTPFFFALASLIDEGKIQYWQCNEGLHHYKLKS